LAAHAPRARIVATDISAAALAMAGRQVARHRLAPRIEFRRADLFAVTDGGPPLGRFDIIISNPPYIDDAGRARLDPEIRLYEPEIALAGGCDGLDFFRAIAGGAGEHLELDGGRGGSEVIVEIGAGQANAVVAIFNRMLTDAGLQRTSVINDLDAIPRVVRVRP
ncbi:MAG TPA: methyltransferase, partial [Candidatus Binataceae bacterium]